MSNMSGQMRTKLYGIISERDSKFCNFCGTTSDKKQLVIDHRDNDNSNNDLENLQLLCRRCNYIKSSREPFDKCVKTPRKETTSLIVNRNKEPRFRRYVYGILQKKSMIKTEKLVYEGAESIELSPVTTKRYLDKMCSKEGLCKMNLGCVTWDYEHPLFKKEILEYDGMSLKKEE